MYWSIRKKVDQIAGILKWVSASVSTGYGDSYTLDDLSSAPPVTHITVTAFTITFIQYRYFLCLMHS